MAEEKKDNRLYYFFDPVLLRMTQRTKPQVSDLAQVKWAWSLHDAKRNDGSVSSRHVGISAKAAAEINASSMRDELLDVVRALNTSSSAMQTAEPSFTATLKHVNMEDEAHRSVGLQCGLTGGQTCASIQVTESDVADGAIDVSKIEEQITVLESQRRDADQPLDRTTHTRHFSHCNIAPDEYPVFIADARALGVANRFGFVSLPTVPELELPPRRRVRNVEPIDYPHLFGSHREQLDEALINRIDRTHALWVANSGFIPKY